MAQMRSVARNITVKPVVPMAYLKRKERAMEEKKELVIKVYGLPRLRLLGRDYDSRERLMV